MWASDERHGAKQNFYNRTLQTVRNDIGSALYDQFSRAVDSTGAAHLRKIDKLLNGLLDHI